MRSTTFHAFLMPFNIKHDPRNYLSELDDRGNSYRNDAEHIIIVGDEYRAPYKQCDNCDNTDDRNNTGNQSELL